jgi:hypothetical protein
MLYFGAMSNKIDVEYKNIILKLRHDLLNLKELAESK